MKEYRITTSEAIYRTFHLVAENESEAQQAVEDIAQEERSFMTHDSEREDTEPLLRNIEWEEMKIIEVDIVDEDVYGDN